MSESDLIIGLGSPLGDDAVGWRVVELFEARHAAQTKAVALREPTQMFAHLGNRERLWIVDGSRGGLKPGSITRLAWPTDCNEDPVLASTHGLGASDVLRLAGKLGRLPPCVVLYAIEIGQSAPNATMSAPVAAAIPEVVERISEEVQSRPTWPDV
jgi:hydrogenase maturation protease